MLAQSAESATLSDDDSPWSGSTRFSGPPGDRRVAESSLRLGGLHCALCAATIEEAVRRVPGVLSAHVSAAGRCATVRWHPARTEASNFVRAIVAAGYTAEPDTAAGARALRQKESRDALWRLFVGALCAMQVMMLATPSYVSAPGELAPDLKRLFDWCSWTLSLPVLCFSAWPFFQGAWRSWRSRRIGMDVPVALGIVVAFIASTGATFDPGGVMGSEVYFDSLTMFVTFLLGGRYLEMRARHRAAISLEQSLGQIPQAVSRVTDSGAVVTVAVSRLQMGDVIRVPVGQPFVADGPLTRGRTEVDESLLNGEATPVFKDVEDDVLAGSINLSAPVEMRVERLGVDTRYEQILALMREAQSHRSSTLQATDRWAAPFLWTVLLLAAMAGVAWSWVDPARVVWVVVSVLIVTCPCALSLATPSALLAAAGAMARRGVLLRRLGAIEGLACMQVLFIDKTGTLTDSPLKAHRLERLPGTQELSEVALRNAASAMAAWSSHPRARALAVPGAPADAGWQRVEESPGLGLQALHPDASVWKLGSARWVGAPSRGDDGDAAIWLSRNGEPVGCFHVEERLRPEAQQCVQTLQADGVRVVLISGDAAPRVELMAQQAGVDEYRGNMLPEDKLQRVQAAQQQGLVVAMLGDGINDAPVLAQADVSLAMGEGAWIARAQADGVLVSNGLKDVLHARQLAKKALRIVRQNLIWAATYNLACVPMALVGWMPPWAAGLGMASSSLLVLLNSLRLSR